MKTPFTYSNEGMFYLNNELITNPDEIWLILKETAAQHSTKETASKEDELKEKAFKKLAATHQENDEYYGGSDYSSYSDEDDPATIESHANLIERNQVLHSNLNISVKKKHTLLKMIRDNEEVYKGFEYQIKFLERGLGLFLKPIVIRRSKDTIHEYCTELFDSLMYQSESKDREIRKLEDMLIGKVVVWINCKDKIFQIINV